MPQPFQNSPASRTFGFGLGRGLTPPFMRNVEPTWTQTPRQQEWNAAIDEQEAALREEAAEQRKAAREESAEADTDRYIQEAQKNPELLSNPFQKMPGLIRSKAFGNIQNVAENAQKSSSLTPNLRARLPVEYRQHFDSLIDQNHPPLAAHDATESLIKLHNQQGELAGLGLPLNQLPKQIVGPVEFAALKNQAAMNKEKSLSVADRERILGNKIDSYRNRMKDIMEMSKGADETQAAKFADQFDDAERAYLEAMADRDDLIKSAFAPKPKAGGVDGLEAGAGLTGGPVRPVAKKPISEQFPTASPELNDTMHLIQDQLPNKKASRIAPPEENEKSYSEYIANPNIPLKAKKAALQKFEQFVQNPPKLKGPLMGIGAGTARRKSLEQALAKAKEDVEFHPVREQFARDWQKSKDEMGNYVRDFAKTFGLDEDETLVSLKKNEEQNIAPPGERPHYRHIRPIFEEFIAKKLGTENLRPFLRSTDERLGDYSNHKFAHRLGVHPFSLPGFPNAGSTLAIGQQPVSNENVLDRYLDDKLGIPEAASTHSPEKNVNTPSLFQPGQSIAAPGGGTITRKN
jgi:hypothetical protein